MNSFTSEHDIEQDLICRFSREWLKENPYANQTEKMICADSILERERPELHWTSYYEGNGVAS